MNAKELENRLKSLAYRIVNVCDALPKKENLQSYRRSNIKVFIFRSSKLQVACKAISKKAFVSKLSIAFEEADETLFWAEVILEIQLIPVEKLSAIIKEAIELASILAAARKTAQASLK